jgi:uncharacterized ferritin-like protein (DUF455 family)/bacterioferritin (cytochrome b1)
MSHYISVEDRRFLRVEEAGRRLQRIAALKKGLMRSLAGWLPRLPDFASKCHLSRHLYLDAKGSQAAATRVWELRFGRKDFPQPTELGPFLATMDRAEDVPEMLAGLYLTVKAELAAAYRRYMAETDPVFDTPSLDVLEPLLRDEERQVEWARGELHRLLLPTGRKAELAAWQEYLAQRLAACGGVLGDGSGDPAYEAPAAFVDRPPYELPEAITFEDMPNHSVEADAGKVPDPHRLVYAYYQEIDIVDLLATILYESPVDMPIAYFVDISRQTWDESRHTTMGIRRLRELGYDLNDCGCPTGRYAAWRRMTVLERISFLTQVGEACSLAGKREHIQRWLAEGDVTSSALVEFDISDESQHVHFGSKWMPELMKRAGETRSRKEMAAHSSLRYRQELYPLKVAAGHTIPDNYLDPFQGCEEVRDPAQSF